MPATRNHSRVSSPASADSDLSPPRSLVASSSASSDSHGSQLDVPSQRAFQKAMDAYLDTLHYTKKEKSVCTPQRYSLTMSILRNPGSTRFGTAQDRHWTKKHFTLDDSSDPSAILRDGRRIATKGQIYDIISAAHVGLGHMGRDKTLAKIKETWSWLPKELVIAYLKLCPTCESERLGQIYVPREKWQGRISLSDDGEDEGAIPTRMPIPATPVPSTPSSRSSRADPGSEHLHSRSWRCRRGRSSRSRSTNEAEAPLQMGDAIVLRSPSQYFVPRPVSSTSGASDTGSPSRSIVFVPPEPHYAPPATPPPRPDEHEEPVPAFLAEILATPASVNLSSPFSFPSPVFESGFEPPFGEARSVNSRQLSGMTTPVRFESYLDPGPLAFSPSALAGRPGPVDVDWHLVDADGIATSPALSDEDMSNRGQQFARVRTTPARRRLSFGKPPQARREVSGSASSSRAQFEAAAQALASLATSSLSPAEREQPHLPPLQLASSTDQPAQASHPHFPHF
ncbi:integrase zinc binding domain-containing protein [Rhodotorula paludigena]|uniref:integrase zinc binding domain-containing protein n=1 Tax=Rhodotorula paludigena TaxID=86838 RepID=UPI00316F33C9